MSLTWPSSVGAVLIIVAAASSFASAADEKSVSHVAAEFGQHPGGNAALVGAMNRPTFFIDRKMRSNSNSAANHEFRR